MSPCLCASSVVFKDPGDSLLIVPLQMICSFPSWCYQNFFFPWHSHISLQCVLGWVLLTYPFGLLWILATCGLLSLFWTNFPCFFPLFGFLLWGCWTCLILSSSPHDCPLLFPRLFPDPLSVGFLRLCSALPMWILHTLPPSVLSVSLVLFFIMSTSIISSLEADCLSSYLVLSLSISKLLNPWAPVS